jgi:hypothetical protein
MKQKHRLHINLRASKFEALLICINITIYLLGVAYFIASWNDIPASISGINRMGEIYYTPKPDFFLLYAAYSSSITLVQVFSTYVWRNNTHKEVIFKVSSDLLKARKQYRIRDSRFFCTLIVIQLFCLIGTVGNIEYQRGHISIALENNLLFIPLSFIIVTWLIHSMLWIRLSD